MPREPLVSLPVEPRDGTGRASWRQLPAAELAEHLLAVPQISDAAWSSDVPRLRDETRPEYIARVLGVELELEEVTS
jgi:hypothetical protein